MDAKHLLTLYMKMEIAMMVMMMIKPFRYKDSIFQSKKKMSFCFNVEGKKTELRRNRNRVKISVDYVSRIYRKRFKNKI